MGRWVALDVETTGLSPTRHHILEVAAVPLDGDGNWAEQVLSFTRTDYQPSSQRVTRAKFAGFLDRIGDDFIIVAHNAPFDVSFLAETLRRIGITSFALRGYCTLRLARLLLPEIRRYDLASLREVLNVPGYKSHVALEDARAVAGIYRALTIRAGIQDEPSLRAVHGPPLQVRYRCRVGAVSSATQALRSRSNGRPQ